MHYRSGTTIWSLLYFVVPTTMSPFWNDEHTIRSVMTRNDTLPPQLSLCLFLSLAVFDSSFRNDERTFRSATSCTLHIVVPERRTYSPFRYGPYRHPPPSLFQSLSIYPPVFCSSFRNDNHTLRFATRCIRFRTKASQILDCHVLCALSFRNDEHTLLVVNLICFTFYIRCCPVSLR